MADSSSYFDSPSWFKASDEDRALVIDDQFNARAAKSEAYAKANDRGKAAIRSAYQQVIEAEALKSPSNPAPAEARAAQIKTDSQGFLANMRDKISRSHAQGIDLVKGATSVNADGTVDKDFGDWGVKYLQKQVDTPKTYAEKKLDADVTSRIKSFSHGGVAEKAQAALGLIGDALTNPEGLAYLGADSAATLTAAYLSGKAGALAGTGVAAGAALVTGGAAAPIAAVTVPVGTTIGTISGVAAHSTALKYMEKIQKSLDENKIPYTAANIQAWMEANPDIIKEHQDTSIKYGGTMGVVSAVTGFIGGKTATIAERAALRQAATSVEAPAVKAALTDIAKKTGRTIEDVTKQTINREAKELLATTSFKSKLGQTVGNYGIQIVSEPIEEAASLAVSGEKITAKELIMETLGGIGGGPYGAVVDKAIFGTTIATDQTKDFIKKMAASTPESRTAASEQKAEIKDAKVQRQAPADLNFKRDVADTDPADPKVDAWADPAHKSYDPIKAATILAKVEDPSADHVDKARKVQNDFRASILDLNDQKEALAGEYNTLVKANDNRAVHVKDQIDNLDKLIEQKTGTYQQVAEQVTKIKNRATMSAQARVITPIDPETATPDQVTEHITASLGSHGNKDAVTNDGIAKLMERPDLSDDQRTMLGALTAANVARKNINDRATSGKSMDEVSEDIYSGDAKSDFKGIDAYRQGITNHLQEGRVAQAEKQLDGLKKFRDAHVLKAQQTSELYDVVKEKGIAGFTPAQAKMYAQMQRENSKFELHPVKSKNFVPNIQSEAVALNAEVTLAESLLSVHKNKGKATTSPATSSAPTANPAAPVVESKPVAPVTLKVTPKPVPAMAEVKPAEPVVAKPTVTADLDINYSALSDEVLQRFADKAEATEMDKLTSDQATKLAAVNKEIAHRHERNALVEDIEINESTDKEISDSLSSNSIESLNDLTITYTDTDGSEVTKPYSEASQELDTEIQEAEDILKCFKSK